MTLSLTGKDKAARVPLNYYKQVGRTRWVITGIVSLLVLGFLGVAWASGWWTRAASPGPVHYVHARWENECQVCHTPFQPTTSTNALQGVLGVGAASDALCQNCHKGPPHHPDKVIPGETGSCASCHGEHKGRNANIMRSPDPTCTRCHANLAVHTQGGKPDYFASIASFDRDHPQFLLGPYGDQKRVPLDQAKDPGKLKFNHHLHLLPGQVNKEGEAGAKTLADLTDKGLRERYRKQQPQGKDKDSDLVQLTCASCHQLDSTDAPAPGPGQAAQVRGSGEYFLPVTFEQHCKACHPLTFSYASAEGKDRKTIEIPHLLQPEDVRRFLSGTLIDAELKPIRDSRATDRPLPGKSLEEMRAAARQDASKAMEALLFQENAEKAERTTCLECHYFQEKKVDGKDTKVVAPTNVPEVWYVHAKFSHQAHRTVRCADCHDAEASKTHLNVLLPGVNNCKACHAPAGFSNGKPTGGVRHECTTCHYYHTGNDSKGGRGAANRGVDERKSPDQVLGGMPAPKSK